MKSQRTNKPKESLHSLGDGGAGVREQETPGHYLFWQWLLGARRSKSLPCMQSDPRGKEALFLCYIVSASFWKRPEWNLQTGFQNGNGSLAWKLRLILGRAISIKALWNYVISFPRWRNYSRRKISSRRRAVVKKKKHTLKWGMLREWRIVWSRRRRDSMSVADWMVRVIK